MICHAVGPKEHWADSITVWLKVSCRMKAIMAALHQPWAALDTGVSETVEQLSVAWEARVSYKALMGSKAPGNGRLPVSSEQNVERVQRRERTPSKALSESSGRPHWMRRRRACSRASEDIKIGDPLTSCNACSESEDRSTPISSAEWIKWSLDNDVQRQWQRGWGWDMLP